jgi:hypothetical protein
MLARRANINRVLSSDCASRVLQESSRQAKVVRVATTVRKASSKALRALRAACIVLMVCSRMEQGILLATIARRASSSRGTMLRTALDARRVGIAMEQNRSARNARLESFRPSTAQVNARTAFLANTS